jgi:CrcB protein
LKTVLIMAPIAYVGVGGMLGAILRYLLSLGSQALALSFPAGTLAANLAGCFLIGVIMQLVFKAEWPSTEMRLLLATGFCGGFTTLSSFVYELHTYLSEHDYFLAAVYLAATMVGAMACFYLGMLLASTLVR